MKTNIIHPALFVSALIACLLSFHACSLPKDTIIDRSTIPACGQSALERFNFARDKSEGLLVRNPTNENIGTFVADDGGPWRPVNGQKMIACGQFVSYSVHDPWGDEHDLNFNLNLDPDFRFLFDEVAHRQSPTGEWKIGCKAPCNPLTSPCLQAEITFDESLYSNPWFSDREDCITTLPTERMCTYGPWVMDGGHDDKPEIHPCEVLWWRNRSQGLDVYTVVAAQDDSNRFDNLGDFDGEPATGWSPWALPPLTESLKIPFEYTGSFSDHLVINIEELKARNVVTPSVSNPGDSDNGNTHILRFKLQRNFPDLAALQPSNILVEVNENIPLGINLGVRFTDICPTPANSIIGFVEVFTAFGNDSGGGEGYQALRITMQHPKQRLPDTLNPGNN